MKKSKNNFFGPYLLLQTIGEGEFAKVKLALHRETGEEVAIKMIKKEWVDSDSKLIKLKREITALKAVRHQYIVKLHDIIETDKYIGLVLEYVSGGELFEHILAHKFIKEKEASRMFAQLISAVSYLHIKEIVHRDLKLENLMLDWNRNLKITDFGFANQFSKEYGEMMMTSCGSPCYAAPELVVSNGMYASTSADVWSCGVILYAMLCGYLPFDDDPKNPDGDNINQLYKYILTTKLTFPQYISEEARGLLKRILVPNPIKRATMAEIRQHKWLESYRDLFIEVERAEEQMLRQLKRTGGNEAIERLKYEQQVKSQRAIEEVIAGEMKRKRQQNEEIRGQKIIEQEEVERILSKANGEMYSNENDAGVAIEEEYEYDDKENEEVRFVERFNKEDIVPTIQQQQQQQQLVDNINSNTGIEMHIDKGNEPTMTVTMTEMEIDMENLFEKVSNSPVKANSTNKVENNDGLLSVDKFNDDLLLFQMKEKENQKEKEKEKEKEKQKQKELEKEKEVNSNTKIDGENIVLLSKIVNPKPEQQPNHSSHTLDYQLPPLQTISPFSSQQSPTIKQNSSQKNEFKPEPKTASEFSRQPDLLASGKTINSKLGEELGVEIGRGIASKPLRYSESRSSIGIPTTPDSSTPSKKLLLWISQFTHNNNNNNNNNSSHSSDFPTNITTNSTTTNTSPLHNSSPTATTATTTATNLSYITQQPKILQYLKVHRGGAIDPNLLSNIPPAELFQRVLMTLDKLGLVVVSTKGLTIRVLRPAKLSTHYNPNLVVGANYPFDLSSISNSASVSNRYDYLFKTPQTTASPSANTDSFFQLQKALSLSPDDLNPSNDKVSTDISLLTNTLSVTNVKIKHTKPTILVPDRTLTLTPTDGSSADRGIHSSYSAPKDLSLKLPFSSYKKKLSSSNSFSSRFSVLRNSILRKSSADKKAGFFEPPPPPFPSSSPSPSPSSSAQTNNNNNNNNTNLHLSTATNAIKPSIVPSFSSCSSSSISYSASKSPPNLPNSSSTPTPTPSSSTSQPPTQPPTQNSTQNSTQSSTQNSTPPPPYGQASNDNGGEVQFIIEICKLKSLSHLFVVSISRRRGNTWSYKYLYNLVADNLNLKDSFDYINSPYTSIILKNN